MNDQNQLGTQPKIQRASRSLHGFFILRYGSVWKERLKISKFATFESNMLKIWLRRVAEFCIVETSFYPPPPSPHRPPGVQRGQRDRKSAVRRELEREREAELPESCFVVIVLVCLFVFCTALHFALLPTI